MGPQTYIVTCAGLIGTNSDLVLVSVLYNFTITFKKDGVNARLYQAFCGFTPLEYGFISLNSRSRPKDTKNYDHKTISTVVLHFTQSMIDSTGLDRRALAMTFL